MKKIIFSLVFFSFLFSSLGVYSQTWTTGSGLLYSNPTTTKVGIGINSPTELLHVNGGALKIGNSTASTDRTSNVLKFGDGSYVQIGEWENDDMLSFKASKYNFTNGNVGIGVTNPTFKLHVNGTGSFNDHLKIEKGTEIGGILTLGNTSKVNANQGKEWKIMNTTGSTYGNSLQFHVYDNLGCQGGLCENRLTITDGGNVGIGTMFPGTKLDVVGTIRAHEVKVCLNQGCDFVFEPDYNLMSLDELDDFVTTNRHLPLVAPAAIMESEGINLSEMNALLLQKVEELTLYVIELNKEIQQLKAVK